MTRIPAPDFDLALSLNCGQVFHWLRHGEGWAGAIGTEPCLVEQHGGELLIRGCNAEAAARYFALDHDLEKIRATLPQDTATQAAVTACRGMRIFRQPLWECISTFITSAQKAVPHIAKISHTLRTRYGHPLTLPGGPPLFTYPEPAALAALTEADLRACALGYRAKNLLRTAQMIASGEVSLSHITTLGDDDALDELCRLPGVGVKVANCVLLFALERLARVPIDVWIERILRTTYRRRRSSPEALKKFAARHFGPFAGYAQQFLFHHARTARL